MTQGVNGLAGAGVNAPSNAPTSLTPRVTGAGRGRHVEPAEASKLREAAAQFEVVFVKQILESSKITAKMGQNGYGGMALDALASGVTKQGGLGLARAIEESILRGTAAAGGPRKPEAP